jgi:thiol-disulfide isomerase/thioredoxin
MSNNVIQYYFSALYQINQKNKQFIVADTNRNKDFSDDIKYEYDINFRNNALADSDFLNKQPITDYTFEKCKDGKIQVYRRRFIIYPDKFYTLRPDNFREKEYLSVLRFRDWWKGKTIINNQKMEFYYQGLSNEYWPIYIKPKETPFTRDDDGFNDQFKHDLKESIRMAGSHYLIDSIAADISKVYLRKIPVTYNKYGNQVGDYLKTTEFKDLNDKAFSTQDIIGKKKFTLLEFWGTWCTPCREMTPVIKKMYKDSPSELNIVSIAVDRDKSAVKQYISKNNMDWKQGWFEHFDNQVLQGLSVHMFPTIILLDAEGKILYKGTTCDTVLGLIR